MPTIDILLFSQRLLLALAVGALIGLEREYTKKQKIAGLRTFGLVSFLGAISAYMSIITESTLFLLVSYIGLIVISYTQYVKGIEQHWKVGLTTLFAFLITFLAGALVFYSLEFEAILISILITVLLFERAKLHSFVRELKHAEITDALEFLVVSFILFSFVPETPLSILGVSFPLKQFFTFVFFVSIVSFIGYILSRLLTADKSMVAIGLASGLISLSAFSARLREVVYKKKEAMKGLQYSMLGAYTTFCLRNLILVLFFSLPLFLVTLPALLSMSLLMALGLIFIYSKGKHKNQHKIRFENPFSVPYAIKIGLIFGTALLIGNLVIDFAGEQAFIITTLIFSLFSSSGMVSAIAFQVQSGNLSLGLATTLVIAATTIDMLVKNIITYKKSKVDLKIIAYILLVGLYGLGFILFSPV